MKLKGSFLKALISDRELSLSSSLNDLTMSGLLFIWTSLKKSHSILLFLYGVMKEISLSVNPSIKSSPFWLML